MADSFIWFTLVDGKTPLHGGKRMKVNRAGLNDVDDLETKIIKEVRESYGLGDIAVESITKRFVSSNSSSSQFTEQVLKNEYLLDAVLPQPSDVNQPSGCNNPVVVTIKPVQDLKTPASIGYKPFPKFNPNLFKVTFPTLEPNNDTLTIQGRQPQLEQVRYCVSNLSSAEKYRPIVISTTRGMGKTFFLKKIGCHDLGNFEIKEVKQAAECGRVLSMECVRLIGAFDYDVSNCLFGFWKIIVVHHLLHIFHQMNVDGIDFFAMELDHLIKKALTTTTQIEIVPTNLSTWLIKMFTSTITVVFSELVRLTNIAFGTNTDCKPVFLLDNIHQLTRKSPSSTTNTTTIVMSTLSGHPHTLLSRLIDQLTSLRPICLLAGTTDGQLEVLAEYSNFNPFPIFLTPLSIEHVNSMGKEMIQHLNNVNSTNVIWPVDIEEIPLTTILVYESCQIPRLLKIAIKEWHNGMVHGKSASTILDNFYGEAKSYYKDAPGFLTKCDPREIAILFLCCSTYFPIHSDKISSTNLSKSVLIDKAIIFPYFGDTYVMPSIIWDWLENSKNPEYIQFLQKVKQCINDLTPGVSLSNLVINLKQWVAALPNATNLGYIWEDIIASSLVAKYKLVSLETGNLAVPLSQIISVDSKSQVFHVIASHSVDFSEGVIQPHEEAKIESKNPQKGVLLNRLIHNAHHDFIMCSKPPIAGQCKYTLTAPDGGNIAAQIPQNSSVLLWIYPGQDEDETQAPRKFTTTSVLKAINNNKIGFWNGAGCVQSLAIDLIRSLKQMVTGKTYKTVPEKHPKDKSEKKHEKEENEAQEDEINVLVKDKEKVKSKKRKREDKDIKEEQVAKKRKRNKANKDKWGKEKDKLDKRKHNKDKDD